MATFLGFVLLAGIWAVLKGAVFLLSIPGRLMRMFSGGTFEDPPEEKKTREDFDPFDYWMDDQGL